MKSIDLDEVCRHVEVPEKARMLLSVPEKSIRQHFSVTQESGDTIVVDAYVVYYNTVRGPAKGGIRLATGVTQEEVEDLAERMVWKTSLVGIPFGGGKSGICVDIENVTPFQKGAIIKEFTHINKNDLLAGDYIPAPDMGTSPREMAIIYGETHIAESVTGKPVRVGGLPGRLEATGRGVATTALLGCRDILGRDLRGTACAIQGFGNVGGWTAHFLHGAGARVVAVSDVTGGIYDEDGLDIPQLQPMARSGVLVADMEGTKISNADLLGLDVDILIPAACENVLTGQTATHCRARLVVEGANGPTTAEGDAVLSDKGIPVLPDVLANAGGVIASYVEWRQAKSGSITRREDVFESIDEIITEAYDRVRAFAREQGIGYRLAAVTIAVEEVVRAMQDRGWL
ncbi:MAG: Glu/Leu/Phe/Val dehydrogenase [Candidatus Brocadiae bacterium]|nr:Glu/Leu/Phe/Val dehydrogenase [Candidatus Brocadiia bacterium]